jgi:hypothetical protein
MEENQRRWWLADSGEGVAEKRLAVGRNGGAATRRKAGGGAAATEDSQWWHDCGGSAEQRLGLGFGRRWRHAEEVGEKIKLMNRL